MIRGHAVSSRIALAVAVPVIAGLSGCGNSIHDLARWGRLDEVKAKLEENPSLLEARNKLGKTPLFFAVSYDQTDVVEYLLAQGADLDARDITGFAPIHAAVIMRRPNQVRLLLEHGASIESADNFGDTPLHVAAYWDSGPMIELLVRLGADRNAKNAAGLTPRDLAAKELKVNAVALFDTLAGSPPDTLFMELPGGRRAALDAETLERLKNVPDVRIRVDAPADALEEALSGAGGS